MLKEAAKNSAGLPPGDDPQFCEFAALWCSANEDTKEQLYLEAIGDLIMRRYWIHAMVLLFFSAVIAVTLANLAGKDPRIVGPAIFVGMVIGGVTVAIFVILSRAKGK